MNLMFWYTLNLLVYIRACLEYTFDYLSFLVATDSRLDSISAESNEWIS